MKLLLPCLFASLAPLSLAATISESLDFSLVISNSTNLVAGPASDTAFLNFAQFNPALGTLTGIEYQLSGSTQTQSLFVSGSRNSGNVNAASVGDSNGRVSLLGLGFPLPVFVDPIAAACSGNPSCFSTVSDSGNPSGNQVILDLSGYTGVGTVTATVELRAGRSNPVGTPIIAAGLTRSVDIDATWDGTITLTYTYITPEPATWSLALGGIGLLALLRRRQGIKA